MLRSRLAPLLTATALLALGRATAEPLSATALYDLAGVRGGLVVHVGCGDGALTETLRVNERYLVQGLTADAAQVATARARLQSRGVYGPISIEQWTGGQLPYASNLVNLLLVSAAAPEVSREELLRVLAPDGVLLDLRSGSPVKTLKPRPDDIDEWTHFLHDASANAVARDREVGPPKRLQWVAGPTWCRSHEFPSSVNGLVVAGGRVFMLFDEGPTGIYNGVPQKVTLTARDAFSGVFLWKVPLRNWQPELGTGTGNRWNLHHTIPRRLVAKGDRVYVTLQFLDSPISILDAATGKVIIDGLEGSRGADELVLSDGVLIAKLTKARSVGATVRFTAADLDDTLAAYDAQTGKPLWRKEGLRVAPYALSALAGRLVYHNMDALVCLDLKTGDEQWRVSQPMPWTQGGSSNLVLEGDVVLFHGRSRADASGKKSRNGFYLTARSLTDGKLLWQRDGKRGQAGACTQPADLFVTNGVVWCGDSLEGLDLHSGEAVKTVTLDQLVSPGHHYRCFRSKATERYLIWPKRGAEFVDVEGDNHMRNDWLRAPCFTGLTPANGLLYVPPSQCFCYPGVLVSGFQAMAADEPAPLAPSTDAALQRGPAYADAANANVTPAASDWPMYRRDVQRSGATPDPVAVDLKQQWATELASPTSPPVVVGDRLWVAEKDAHRVRCLDARTGREVWAFTAGGRVDSPPTIAGDLVLFGCRNGVVYCLRASDGALVWKFRAAPDARQLVSYNQLESVWPVSGSVLVLNGVVYFAAGRSSFLDGGMLVYGLDARSGKVLYHHALIGPWPDIKKDVGTPFAMEGARPDLLVSDGKDLFMLRIKFDAQLNRLPVTQESPLGELDMGSPHLVATGGFLDDTGFDRLFWMHSHRWPGFYFAQQSPKAGQLVVFDDTTCYAVKQFYRRIIWSPAFFPGTKGYLLYADALDNEPTLDEKGKPSKALEWLPKEAATDKHRRGGRGVEKGTGYIREKPAKWQEMIPLRVRAMVLAGDRLVAAGTPDVLDSADPLAALEGRAGAELRLFSAKDGALLKSQPLPSVPAFDGLIAVQGKLYLSTLDGRMICYGG